MESLENSGPTVTLVTGIDVQSIEEVKDSLVKFGDRYRRKLFSNDELAECETNHEDMANGLALRFAAKEAVLKVLRPMDHIPSWPTIEIYLPPRHTPRVDLTGEAEILARQCGVETISLSVSLARGFAIAAVIAEVKGKQADEHQLAASSA